MVVPFVAKRGVESYPAFCNEMILSSGFGQPFEYGEM